MSNKKTNIQSLRSLFRGNLNYPNIIENLKLFPVSIIDDFFKSPKLTKPSSPLGKEEADLIRLCLIAFSPEGSIAGSFRGKKIPRFFRNSSEVEDLENVLTLSNHDLTIDLLGDLARHLSIKKLVIESQKSLDTYLRKPFDVQELCIGRNIIFNSDFSSLPSTLFSLTIFSPRHISTADLAFLKQVKKLNLMILSGAKTNDSEDYSILDVSNNPFLEEVFIDVKTTKNENKTVFFPWCIRGLGSCHNLIKVEINCKQPFGIQEDYRASVEPFDLDKMPKLTSLTLKSVHYKSEITSKNNSVGIILTDVIGANQLTITNNLNSKASFSIRECKQVSSISISGGCYNVDISDCENIKTIAIKANKIIFLNLNRLPVLDQCALECDEMQQITISRSALTSLPRAVKPILGLKKSILGNSPSFILINNWNLISLSGLEFFVELEELELREENNENKGDKPSLIGHQSMRVILDKDSPPIPSLKKLVFNGCNVKDVAGISNFQNLSELTLSGRFETIDELGYLGELTFLDLSGAINLKTLKPLNKLKKLKALKLKDCGSLSPKPTRINFECGEIHKETSRYL